MPEYVPIQDLTIAGSVDDSDLFPMSDGSGAYAVRGSTIKSYAAGDAAAAASAAQSAAAAAAQSKTAAEAAQSAAESAVTDAAASEAVANASMANVRNLLHEVGYEGTIVIGQTWNSSGSTASNTKRARSAKRNPDLPREIGVSGETYLINALGWDSPDHVYGYLASDWTNERIMIPSTLNAFAIVIKRADDAVIASSEEDAIKAALKLYYLVDEDFGIRGVPADSLAIKNKLYKSCVVKVKLEHGVLETPNSDFGKGWLFDSETRAPGFLTHMRTPNMIDVSKSMSLALSSKYDNYRVYEYAGDCTFLNAVDVADGNYTVPNSVSYIRVVCFNTGEENITDVDAVLTVESVGKITVTYSPNSRDGNTTIIQFVVRGNTYNSDRDGSKSTLIDSNALLRLPPNYDPLGVPVPLIVYMHGTSGYRKKWKTSLTIWDSTDPSADDDLKVQIITYLVNEGFAVMSIFGHSSDAPYIDNYAYPYGNKDQMKCIATALERIMSVYNLDKTGIYIDGLSAGGVAAINYLLWGNFPVRACSLQAPTISVTRKGLGQSESNRKEWAWANGLVGNTDVLNGKNGENPWATSLPAITQDLIDYLEANIDKINGYNPMWEGIVGVPQDTLNTRAFTPTGNYLGAGDDTPGNWDNVSRVQQTPICLWVANDDINIDPVLCHNYITTLKNGHSIAEEVIIPDGQGGHAAFTASETVPHVSGTTALGIEYEGIPWPWIDMVRFFREH